MPFDERAFPSGREPGSPGVVRRARQVAAWLGVIAAMMLVMIVLGGATRLTGSGLSIMEWAPVSGVLPPLSQAEWERLFALYRRTSQFELVNSGFDLAAFQRIFWLEWVHRLWGRTIGVAFAVPLVWFAWRGALGRTLVRRLVLFLVLGGVQGAVGWFMVASGFFAGSTAVSAYRLVAHLTLAVALYAAVVQTAFATWPPARARAAEGRTVRWLAGSTVLATFATIVAGGFVAGLHAGLDYNTFPLMAGRVVPAGYGTLEPFARNWFENVAAVQFNHRLLATLTAVLAAATVAAGWSAGAHARSAKRALLVLGAAVALQYALGVATLLSVVPVGLAVAHQASAMLLLTAALYALHMLRDAAPAEATRRAGRSGQARPPTA